MSTVVVFLGEGEFPRAMFQLIDRWRPTLCIMQLPLTFVCSSVISRYSEKLLNEKYDEKYAAR